MRLRSTIDFLLYDWLQAEGLTAAHAADHSRETFDAVLDTCERIAREKYAPFNRTVDTQEPQFDGERSHLPHAPMTPAGLCRVRHAGRGAGLRWAACSCPTRSRRRQRFFARPAWHGLEHADLGQCQPADGARHRAAARVFAANEFAGRWFGTMCLSEPQAGSSLSDIHARRARWRERAMPGPALPPQGQQDVDQPGEHELTENIVHLVLAKIPARTARLIPGVKGISLFIVPKKLVDRGPADRRAQRRGAGRPQPQAGLARHHQCLLNFRRRPLPPWRRKGAIGYLVGKPGGPAQCMFHMMNEARIGVGLGAVMLGYGRLRGQLDYAQSRPQGRPMAGRQGCRQPQSRIIEHADVRACCWRRRPIAKAAGAGAVLRAAGRRAAHRPEPEAASQAAAGRADAIAKSWPSEWCLEANSLAIQVLAAMATRGTSRSSSTGATTA
jgi:butyryl-CoA dehydrogenase